MDEFKKDLDALVQQALSEGADRQEILKALQNQVGLVESTPDDTPEAEADKED